MTNKPANALACVLCVAGLPAAAPPSVDTDANPAVMRAAAASSSRGGVAEASTCGGARWRDGVARDVDSDGRWQGCFEVVLRELADGMDGSGPFTSTPEPGAARHDSVDVLPASTASDVDVDIPDAGLRDALAEQLGKNPDEAITADEMATLTTFSATDRGITDLTGLRHATGLRELHLDRNAIVDVAELGELSELRSLSLAGNAVADASPLARLQLRSLSLARNGLGDVEALSGLSSLESLDLADNEIGNIRPLNLLTRLRSLTLDDNRVWNPDPLRDLQALDTLRLDGNLVVSVAPLAALTGLRTLSLADNFIADVWHLSGLTSIERLSLRGNRIADLSPLSGLTGLTQLWLGTNELMDISALAGLVDLVLLDLGGNRIVDVGPLGSLTGLIGLGAGNNQIADATALSALTELTALDLGGNALGDVPPLAGLANLKTLWLDSNGLSGIAQLSSLGSLSTLALADNDIVDIGPLAGLTGLATLSLDGNAIADIGALAGLDNLKGLWLSGNMLTDLSPLSALTGLAALSVSRNEVEDISAVAGLVSLQRLWLDDNGISDVSALAGFAELETLSLSRNAVADMSPLEGLGKLRRLHAPGNDIRDVSPLAGLGRLATLDLGGNGVVDIGPLSGLADMRHLVLDNNRIAEIGAVGRLQNLSMLDIASNDVGDIRPLVDNPGMGPGDLVDLRRNPLGATALEQVDALRGKGVRVLADVPDLVAESAWVSHARPDPGGPFTLGATVRNAGAAVSAETTLRYYRSADAAISEADTEVGSDDVAGLAAGAESAVSIELAAPAAAGTYYYGACVDAVPGEADAANNCSAPLEVEVGGAGRDDHGDTIGTATTVSVPSTTPGNLEEGGDKDYFRLAVPEATTLVARTTGGTDTFGTLFDADGILLETDDDGGVGTNFRIERAVDAGTYHVEVRGFSGATTGAYTLAVASRNPDLVVESVSVSDATPGPAAVFALSATVRNTGEAPGTAWTTLRYYRSGDAAVTAGDTEVGTDAVPGLAAGDGSDESISLRAPAEAGTYYYGACIDAVPGETDAANNCSDGVSVQVVADAGNTDPDAVWVYRLVGESLGSLAGSRVAAAGIDAGIGRLLVGSWSHAYGRGAAYLISGRNLAAADRADGLEDRVVDLGDVPGQTLSWAMVGEPPGTRAGSGPLYDRVGYAVANGGDHDGDGLGDVWVGAVGRGGWYAGEVILVTQRAASASGDAEGWIHIPDLAEHADTWILSGEADEDHAGFSIASADVDGDGVPDVLVGAPWHDGGTDNGGAVYIASRSALSAADADDGEADRRVGVGAIAVHPGGWKLLPEANGDRLGFEIATVGDVDGDDRDDFLIAAPFEDRSAVYLVAAAALDGADAEDGSRDGMVELGRVADGRTSYKLVGVQGNGQSLAARDLDGDGIAELLIGGTWRVDHSKRNAYAYVVAVADLPGADAADGAADGIVEIERAVNGSGSYKLTHEPTYPYGTGVTTVASADFDGDGWADVIVGVPRWGSPWGGLPGRPSPTEIHLPGAVYLLSGRDLPAAADDGTGSIDLEDVAALPNSWKVVGASGLAADELGWSVGSAGDLDGDGIEELAFGTPWQPLPYMDSGFRVGPGGVVLLSGADLASADSKDGVEDGVVHLDSLAIAHLGGERPAPSIVEQYGDHVVVIHVPGDYAHEYRPRLDQLAQIFLSEYEDVFDYLMFVSNLPPSDPTYYAGDFTRVHNRDTGVGISTSDPMQDNRLRGFMHFSYVGAFTYAAAHEIMHSWANFVVDVEQRPHWGFSSANGQLGGFDLDNLVDLGDGKYTAGGFSPTGNEVPYGPLELYLAGWIPAEDVPDIWVAEDGQWTDEYDDDGNRVFTASNTETLPVEAIVEEYGVRVPGYEQSQKSFRGAVILIVDDENPQTDAVLAELAEDVRRFAHPRADDHDDVNFWEATGGRATITLGDLSGARRPESLVPQRPAATSGDLVQSAAERRVVRHKPHVHAFEHGPHGRSIPRIREWPLDAPAPGWPREAVEDEFGLGNSAPSARSQKSLNTTRD